MIGKKFCVSKRNSNDHRAVRSTEVLMAAFVLLLACAEQPAQKQTATKDYLNETKTEREARMKWWRESRFGMFIHWGVYAVPAGEYKGERVEGIGEWIQASLNIPRDEYAQAFPPKFNPVKFDAAEWVRLAKEAGMKYIVITSKHHDGFALWDSKVSEYDIVDATPYGKDVLAALAQACKKQGVRLCFYHSILDWHHPAQYVDTDAENPRRGHSRNKMHADRKQEYVAYLKAQLRELVSNYDPNVLWFDGEWGEWWTEEDGKALYNYVRSLKPEIVINNRVGKGRKGMQGLNKGPGYAGDFGTPEQQIPDTGLVDVDWESCMTMNDTWGFKYFDDNWKSTETLLRNLIDIASKGGNYLLNVGPTAGGLIPQPSIDRLREIGAWLKVNGEAVYGTQASPFPQPAWGRYTRKPGKIYALMFDWPDDGKLNIPRSDNQITKAYLLADVGRKPLTVSRNDREYAISLPDKVPNSLIPVIGLEVNQE